MNQAIKPAKAENQPTLQEQIDFIRRCKNEKLVIQTKMHVDMFRVIEENLISVKLWNDTFTKTLEEGSKEVSND